MGIEPREWRWDGERWVIDSPDRRHVWDGRRWLPAGVPRDGRRRGRRVGMAVAAVGLTALLVLSSAGAGAWLALDRLRAAAPPARSTGQASSASASRDAALRAFIPEAQRFVEDRRGLKFKAPVDIKFVGDNEFQKLLLEGFDKNAPDLVKEGKLLRALGLVDPGVDLVKAQRSLLTSSVIGYYDPDTKQLVVRGAEVTPVTKHVLVHELTHALQDQHFSIGKAPSGQAGDESGMAFLALVEGDAIRIEQQYISSLSTADQRQALSRSTTGGPGADVPPVLVEILAFPYLAGAAFVEAVLSARGQAGLDAAFVKRPQTTAQLLQPEKFLAGVGSLPVTAPSADGQVVDSGVLGQLGLLLMLEKPTQSGRLSGSDARQASQGWGGDQYVAWDQGQLSCVRARFVADGPASATVLLKAMQAYAAVRPAARVEGSGPVTVTSCG